VDIKRSPQLFQPRIATMGFLHFFDHSQASMPSKHEIISEQAGNCLGIEGRRRFDGFTRLLHHENILTTGWVQHPMVAA
jgi:hypothetical protein